MNPWLANSRRIRSDRKAGTLLMRFLALFALSSSAGCAALTNPVANGYPVEQVPPELLGHSREGEQNIAMNLLGQPQPPAYLLDGGDVVGVFIEGVLDDKIIVPVVRVVEKTRLAPERRDLPSGLGYPVEIRRDGTLSLPQIKPLMVKGLTIEMLESGVRQAYVDAKILQPDKGRVFVTLLNRRLVHVLVFRRDQQGGRFFDNLPATRVGLFGGGAELIGTGTTGVGQEIVLPAYENDLLHALALTGGFPGTNAARTISIYRRNAHKGASLGLPVDKVKPAGAKAPVVEQRTEFRRRHGLPELPPGSVAGPCPPMAPALLPDGLAQGVTQVQIRIRPGEPFFFDPQDVVLQDGDAVFVEAASLDTFYTAGLLPSGEHILPRDYDLDIVEAVARVRGPIVNGAFGGNNLTGTLINPGIGNPSPRLITVIRRTPDGGQIPIRVDLHKALVDSRERILIQPHDVLVLQETKWQALSRYIFTDTLNVFSSFKILNRRDALASVFYTLP